MTVNEIQPIISASLSATASLIEGPYDSLTTFQRLLLAVLRRNYLSLYSLSYLSDDLQNGDAILDISRKMLEDMVSIEFIKLRGKEEMSKKFFDYIAIERKTDSDFLTYFGIKESNEVRAKVIEDYELVKKQFTYKKDVISRSWAKCDLDQRLKELVDENVINQMTAETLAQDYVIGNRKNHLSPTDALSFLDQEYRDSSQKSGSDLGLATGMFCFLKIAADFVTEMGYRNKEIELEGILKKLTY